MIVVHKETLSNQAFLSLMANLLGVSAELQGWAQQSSVSSSGKQLCFGLGSITSSLCAFSLPSLSALIFGAGTICLFLHPGDPLPAVTSWHSSDGRCTVPPSLSWGWAVLIICIHWCASIPSAKCCALSTAITSRCPKQKCTGSVASKSAWEHRFTSLKVPHLFLNGKNNNAKL